jgi:hypothetical protein
MRNMKTFFLGIAIFFFCTLNLAQAQDYRTGAGARLGTPFGVSLKHFIGEQSALEGIAAIRFGGINLTGLYQYHFDIDAVERLRWYVGGGAHLGFYNHILYGNFSQTGVTSVIGIDGIIGIEYAFEDIPIVAALDWKPAFDIVGGPLFIPTEVAITIRYTFRPRDVGIQDPTQ